MENLANLQRPVDWSNPKAPLDFADDLPDEISAKPATQHDVLDLTEFVCSRTGELRALKEGVCWSLNGAVGGTAVEAPAHAASLSTPVCGRPSRNGCGMVPALDSGYRTDG
ncbi:hypothetical protein [Streptosporangium sp. CA-115845]|uniref:hypothetical protein n=1 Tax=Streptosporangium sp. CA-115845 TaxID=3240071 RepID=UPI003D8FAD0A